MTAVLQSEEMHINKVVLVLVNRAPGSVLLSAVVRLIGRRVAFARIVLLHAHLTAFPATSKGQRLAQSHLRMLILLCRYYLAAMSRTLPVSLRDTAEKTLVLDPDSCTIFSLDSFKIGTIGKTAQVENMRFL